LERVLEKTGVLPVGLNTFIEDNFLNSEMMMIAFIITLGENNIVIEFGTLSSRLT